MLAGFGYTVADPDAIVWTDITQYVDIETVGIGTTRGASDEVSDIQPGSCSLLLDDDDGRFTPGLATSPYSPNVKKNTPVRMGVVSAVKNLMVNPSFEDGVTDWTSSGTPTRAQSTTHVQDGTYSMLATWGATLDQTVTSPVLYGFDIGQQYTFSAYVWVPAGHATVYLTVAGITNGTANTVFGAFQRLTVTWTATSTSHQVRLRATNTPAAGNTAWIDACQIEEGTSATTYDSNGARNHDRLWCMVNEWPLRLKGLEATTSITCTDLFKWLSRQPALQPMLAQEILATGALAYYPLAEDDSSTSAGDLAGTGATALAGQQLSVGGTLAFAGATGPAETGQSCPLFTPASASAGLYLKGDLGDYTEAQTAINGIIFEAWFSTSTQGRVILGASSADGITQIVFSLESGTGKLRLQWTNAGDPVSAFTSTVTASANLADGVLHHLLYDSTGGGVYIDGVLVDTTGATLMHNVRTLYVGGYTDGRLWSGAIAHVAVTAHIGSLSEYLPHYTAGATGFAGEDADVRIERLARYVGVASLTPIGAAFDPVASQGPGGSTALAMMKKIEATESARLFADKDYFGLTLMSRDVRYNPVAEVSVSYADLETDEVELSDDDQKMVNIVIASRPGGATQRVINQDSIDAYGPYEQPLDILKTSDNSVLDAANWTVSRYADPLPELREVVVDAYTLGTAAYRDLLDLGLSGILTVTDLPAQAPTSSQTVYVEGYTETIKRNSHVIAFHVSRSYNDAVWVLDDATYSVLGSTTRLAY